MADSKELPKFSKAELASIFGLSRTTVTAKLRNVAACGKDKRGHDVYSIPKAAQWLVDFSDRRSVEDFSDGDGHIDPDKLMPMDRNAWFQSEIRRKEFERIDGECWDTLEVMDAFASVFKLVMSNLRGFSDAVKGAASFTPKQEEILQEQADSVIKDIHEGIVEYVQLQKSE